MYEGYKQSTWKWLISCILLRHGKTTFKSFIVHNVHFIHHQKSKSESMNWIKIGNKTFITKDFCSSCTT